MALTNKGIEVSFDYDEENKNLPYGHQVKNSASNIYYGLVGSNTFGVYDESSLFQDGMIVRDSMVHLIDSQLTWYQTSLTNSVVQLNNITNSNHFRIEDSILNLKNISTSSLASVSSIINDVIADGSAYDIGFSSSIINSLDITAISHDAVGGTGSIINNVTSDTSYCSFGYSLITNSSFSGSVTRLYLNNLNLLNVEISNFSYCSTINNQGGIVFELDNTSLFNTTIDFQNVNPLATNNDLHNLVGYYLDDESTEWFINHQEVAENKLVINGDILATGNIYTKDGGKVVSNGGYNSVITLWNPIEVDDEYPLTFTADNPTGVVSIKCDETNGYYYKINFQANDFANLALGARYVFVNNCEASVDTTRLCSFDFTELSTENGYSVIFSDNNIPLTNATALVEYTESGKFQSLEFIKIRSDYAIVIVNN